MTAGGFFDLASDDCGVVSSCLGAASLFPIFDLLDDCGSVLSFLYTLSSNICE